MHPVKQWKLDKLRKAIGDLTADEALTLAIEAEQFKIACGPFDPAYEFLCNQERTMLEYATLLEEEQQEKATAG